MANYTVKVSSAPQGHEIPELLRELGAFVATLKHELALEHDVLHDDYPVIAHTAKTFLPYVVVAWVTEKFGEPVLGVPWNADEGQIEAKLGKPTGLRTKFAADVTPTVPYWTRELGADVVLDISFRNRLRVDLHVKSASHLEKSPDVTTAVFLAWAALRGLLDASRFAAHADLVARVKERKATGADLVKSALPRGLWDTHLVDKPDLRATAYRWFYNIGGTSMAEDLKGVFGEDEDDELELRDDSWENVDKAAKVFDERFAAWLA